MKDKFILVGMIALFIVAGFFTGFSFWLVQKLGYYLLLIDGLFAVVLGVLVWWLKSIEDAPTKELDAPETRPFNKP